MWGGVLQDLYVVVGALDGLGVLIPGLAPNWSIPAIQQTKVSRRFMLQGVSHSLH